MVLGASKWGLVVWRLSHVMIGNMKCFTSRVGLEDSAWFFVPITDIKKWRVAQVVCKAPVQVGASTRDKSVRDQVAWTRGPTQDVLEAAARHGFSQLTVPLLDKLIAFLRLTFTPGARPKSEADMVNALVEHCLPNASQAEKAACLVARRRAFQEDALAMLANPENLEKLEGAVDEDDYEIIKKATELFAKTKAKWAASDKPSPAAGSSQPELPARPRTWSERPMPTKDVWTLEEARTHLPANASPRVILSKDTKRFSRWSATYPGRPPPCTVTKSWGPRTGFTMHSALCYVLHTVWTWHEEATGEEAPFNFAEGLPNIR